MAVYGLVGTIVREVKETILLEIEADDPDEAQDIAYDILSEYPMSEFAAERLRVIQRIGNKPTGVAVEFQKKEVEEVFEDESDDDPA